MKTTKPDNTVLNMLCALIAKVQGIDTKFVLNYGKKQIKYIVEIKRFRTKRSIDQNAVLYMWLTYLENQTGNDKDVLYRMFENKFQLWTRHDLGIFGEFYSPKKIKHNNTAEFNECLKKIRGLVLDRSGYWLPLPDEPEWDNFYLTYKDK